MSSQDWSERGSDLPAGSVAYQTIEVTPEQRETLQELFAEPFAWLKWIHAAEMGIIQPTPDEREP